MSHIAPRISLELRESIERLLQTRVMPLGILKAQREELREYQKKCRNENANILWTKDMLLGFKDIQEVHQLQEGDLGQY
ncbi:unnamed protein product [Calypogeia fissa]